MKITLIAILSLLIVACSSEKKKMVHFNFKSMFECLAYVQLETGQSLRPVTDKPTKVTGFLGETSLQFYCGVEQTGTKGTFVRGWYEKVVKK